MEDRTRILLVEDEFISALLMEKMLTRMGCLIVGKVMTGEDAIAFAHDQKPDLVVMDIGLAGEMDGIEAAAAIRLGSDVPVIFITGYSDREIRERAEQTNPMAYLLKPIDIEQLKSVIETHFANVN